MTLQFHMISGAPDPVAPFSHAVEADGWVHVTGQMPFAGTSVDDPYPDGIEAQTRQVMRNLHTVLRGVGLDWPHVASVRVYLLHFEGGGQKKACSPVWARPRMSACTSCVPS
jgi:2-iminobutanoate/2-iminopropanoate deaminase